VKNFFVCILETFGIACSILKPQLFNGLSSRLCVEIRYLTVLLCGDKLNNFGAITCVEVCKHLSVISAQLQSWNPHRS